MSPQLPDHVPSLAHAIIITAIIVPILSTIVVLIRVWTRIVVTHNLGLDDYAAMVTLLFCISFSVVLGVSTMFGMGLHLRDVSLTSEYLFPGHGTYDTGSVPFSTTQLSEHYFKIPFDIPMSKC